jgi:3-deoxy-D-manno-octulosonic-acid transferase/heptosyltransferase-1
VNILIVKLSAIGDVIHTLPALNAIRECYPAANITWLVEAAAADLIIGHRALDRVIVSKRKQWARQLKGPERATAFKELRIFFRAFRDTDYDIVIDFQSLLKRGVMVWLAPGKRKIGFGKGMQHQEHSYLFLNERVPPVDMEIHALTRGLILLEAIGIKSRKVVYDVPVSESDHAAIAALLRDRQITGTRPMVAMNPVALWETKMWLTDRFAALADRLIRVHGMEVVFTGGPDDRIEIDNIRQMMTAPAANLAGRTTLKMLAALYQRSALLVTTDTGPMHLAAAVDTPVVALFGPTAPWRTGPFGVGHQVIQSPFSCSPCFKRQCETNDCMAAITVDVVWEGINAILDRYPS